MRVLVGCEHTDAVASAFRAVGHEAFSCDLLPTEGPIEWHIQGDIFDAIKDGPWDLMVAHPPCTYLSSSGLHWNKRRPGRQEKTDAALEFVRRLMGAPVGRICIENPVGCISTKIRPATQYIQPYQFGHDASKKTGLWLKNLPPLRPTLFVEPRMVDERPRWSNQTDSGQNRLPPSKDRWKIRSATYDGIAKAMATQWNY